MKKSLLNTSKEQSKLHLNKSTISLAKKKFLRTIRNRFNFHDKSKSGVLSYDELHFPGKYKKTRRVNTF